MAANSHLITTRYTTISAFILVIVVNSSLCNRNSEKTFFGIIHLAKVQSLRCFALDPDYVKFDICSLKPINRTLKYVNVHVLLYKPPINAAVLHFRILKKANGGYKPFGIDVKLDACQYLAGRRNPVFDWCYDLIEPYSNFNHSCPYVSSVFVKDFPFQRLKLPSVFPEGEYRVEAKVDCYGVPRAAVHIYVTIM